MFKRANVWVITKIDSVEHDEEDAGIHYFSLALSGQDHHYLEFQLSLDADERIDSDGNDEGYCVINGPHEPPGDEPGRIDLSWLDQPAYYGGVRSCIFRSDSITLEFSKDLAAAFRWPAKLTLKFEVDQISQDRAKTALRRVLSNPPTGEFVSILEE
jgi:hypothetical protein